MCACFDCCYVQVPYLRAPYFVWVGRPWSDAQKQLHHEQKVEAPAMFPPTFLYTQSWEDPEPDMKVIKLLQFQPWSRYHGHAGSHSMRVFSYWHIQGHPALRYTYAGAETT